MRQQGSQGALRKKRSDLEAITPRTKHARHRGISRQERNERKEKGVVDESQGRNRGTDMDGASKVPRDLAPEPLPDPLVPLCPPSAHTRHLIRTTNRTAVSPHAIAGRFPVSTSSPAQMNKRAHTDELVSAWRE
eukprot:1690657-Rhodomonas_salina.5